MSTTRSQKRSNTQQESAENVSGGVISAVLVRDEIQVDQDVMVAGPSSAKSPRIENSIFENLRASLKDEITSEIKTLLVESQKKILKLLKPKTNESVVDEPEDEPENETRSFYTPTKLVRLNSTQNKESNASRNNITGIKCIQQTYSAKSTFGRRW